MKHTILFLALLANFAIIVYLSVHHVSLVLDNTNYKLHYETMRGELEAVYRTQARGIDPAFTCKFKVAR